MKIEDIKYEIPKEPIDDTDFDIEKWRLENPMDYFKAMYLINKSYNKDFVFKTIYDISRKHIPDTLFKYYSLTDDENLNEKKFKTLKQKKIFMSDVEHLNDPFDNKGFFYNPNKLKKYKRLKECEGKIIDDFSKFFKVTSLTAAGINSMPMWAHYANNHAGFCVSYDMNGEENKKLRSITFPIQYTDNRVDITSLMDKQIDELHKQLQDGTKKIEIKDLTLIYLQSLFCNLKNNTWNYEKEFRCSIGRKIGTYVEATPKAIYIGMKCLNKHKKELKKIAKQLHVPIYQMQFDDLSENFNLISKIIKF